MKGSLLKLIPYSNNCDENINRISVNYYFVYYDWNKEAKNIFQTLLFYPANEMFDVLTTCHQNEQEQNCDLQVCHI